MAKSFTYRGIGSSFDSGESGIPQAKTDIDLVTDSLEQAIFTQMGERVMNPDFGSRIYSMVFDGDYQFMEVEIAAEIIRAAEKWCPRVQIRPGDIKVEKKEEEIIITVDFLYMKEEGKIVKSISTRQ